MVCIVNYASKRELKEAVASGIGAIEDRSINFAYHGPIEKHPGLRHPGNTIYATNHPKRSWFAQIRRTKSGELRVQ